MGAYILLELPIGLRRLCKTTIEAQAHGFKHSPILSHPIRAMLHLMPAASRCSVPLNLWLIVHLQNARLTSASQPALVRTHCLYGMHGIQ